MSTQLASSYWRVGRRVLLAEDDSALRSMLKEALEADGWDVRAVGTGFALADELCNWLSADADPPAEVLISDLWMPGLTGLEVLEGLSGAGLRIPTILMSAFCSKQDRLSARQLGALAVLDKPFETEDLLAIALYSRTLAPAAAPRSRPMRPPEEGLG